MRPQPRHTARRPGSPALTATVLTAATLTAAAGCTTGGATAHPAGHRTRDATAAHTTTASPRESHAGHPLVGGAGAGWQLFGWSRGRDGGPGAVVRLWLARGRITRTAVPTPRSGGPVSFLAGPHQAIVRPLDFVPGYAVPDGRPARELTGPLGAAGPALPGPARGELWVPSPHDRHRMRLVRFDGTPAGVSVRVSTGARTTAGAASDGAGQLLVRTGHGTYQVGASGWRRITTGTLLAAGPTRFLIRTRRHGRHRMWAVDRRTGDRRQVKPSSGPRPATADRYAPMGVVSPDGTTAALVRPRHGGPPTLHLLDLTTGADHPAGTSTPDHLRPADGGVVWSPDGRWLFAIDSGRHIVAVSRRTGRAIRVAADLPPMAAIALRDGR